MVPAIVVVTYSRENSLRRLLNSLSNSFIDETVDLYISIDKGNKQQLIKYIANDFEWQCGNRLVIEHNEKLGLKKHILCCGELTIKHEFIIVLEDDLVVSPFFFKYARVAFEKYKSVDSILGISLYKQSINETTLTPFLPLKTSDSFFLQLPCSWGQVWHRQTWLQFKEWLESEEEFDFSYLPQNIQRWSTKSWKKIQLLYMIRFDKFYVYPHESYTTNFGDAGEHVNSSNIFQVPLVQFWKIPILADFHVDNSIKYDAWHEITYNKNIFNLDFDCLDVDINGSKNFYHNDYVITTKSSKKPLVEFSDNLTPLEMNIINGNRSSRGQIVLTHKNDIRTSFIKRIKFYIRMFNMKPSISMILRIMGRY